MGRRTTTSITATAALMLAALAPTDARAADPEGPELISTSVSPRVVAVGITKVKQVRVEARTTAPQGTARVTATIGGLATGFSVSLTATELGADSWIWQGDLQVPPAELDNVLAGAAETTFASYGRFDDNPSSGEIVDTEINRSLALVRAARLSVNAAPESPRRGQTITVTGTLQRADWDEGVYRGYRNRPVQLLFRPAGGTTQVVKTVTSGAGGALRTTAVAERDGSWSWRYGGNVVTGTATSPRDALDVR
jgi:hypothetical protein